MATLRTVVRRDDYLKSLMALRDYLAKALDETDSPRDQASLSLRLADVLAQIHELKKESEEAEDELDGILINRP